MTKKTPGAQLVEEVIGSSGPISFERFMDLALYHPRYGYYNRGEPQRGRGGDYFTALQVSDLFPAILAEAVWSMKETLGTDQFALVEWGAGDGELMAGILQALAAKDRLKGIRAWAVETGRPARERLHRKLSRFPKCQVVSSLDDIEIAGGFEGCFLSNEFFDALPFRRLRWRGGSWQEIFVDVENGSLVERERRLEGTPVGGLANIPEGQEIEVRPALDKWVAEWGSRLVRGYVLTVDYGVSRSELVSPRRLQGTWRCFYKHSLQTDPYQHIGQADLTAHVDFTHLVEAGNTVGWSPAVFASQGVLLSHLGAGVIEQRLADQEPASRAKTIGAIQQLLHPQAMGESFWALLQTKEALLPPIFQNIPNRIRRLI